MTIAADKLHLEYLGTAIFMLGVAYGLMKWVGRTIRDQLGPGMNRGEMPFLPPQAEIVPPGLVKRAIEHGLVTAEQLATMTPVERQFLFASLTDKLTDKLTDAPAPPSPMAQTSPAPTGLPSSPPAAAPRAINGAEFGVAALPVNDRLRVFCPACGGVLAFPAFAPFVARCARCGTKTTLREETVGRYVLHVAPPAADAAEEPAPP